jgi:NAD(P)-dependent dehydrogenase (short-subunit alcohol dehydrogenase family)
MTMLHDHVGIGNGGQADDRARRRPHRQHRTARYVTGHVLVVDGGWMAR